MEHVLSTLSLVASVLYCGIGCYAYAQNRQSILHKKFLHLSILMTIWAFFYMFAYLATTNAKFVLFNNIAAIGWCLFPAAVLSFCLTLGNYQSIKSSIVTMLLYVPGICFFLFAIYGFSGDKTQRLLMYQVFNIGNFLYNFLYLVGAMVLIYLWGKRAAKAHEKKQAAIILYASFSVRLASILTAYWGFPATPSPHESIIAKAEKISALLNDLMVSSWPFIKNTSAAVVKEKPDGRAKAAATVTPITISKRLSMSLLTTEM